VADTSRLCNANLALKCHFPRERSQDWMEAFGNGEVLKVTFIISWRSYYALWACLPSELIWIYGSYRRWISPSRNRYLHTQIFLPRMGFEPTTPVLERAKTGHSIDRTVSVIDSRHCIVRIMVDGRLITHGKRKY
jgi:hypothetical protein